MRVLTFSRYFPSYHPRKGEETLFMEKIWKGLNTGNRRDGEYSVWAKHPRQMKDGHWQLPHLWRDKMIDKSFTPKFHTIRAGNRWNVGDWFSPRIWSGLPYRSKQIEFAPPIQVKKTWKFEMDENGIYSVDGEYTFSKRSDPDQMDEEIAKNDGLSSSDFYRWFMVNWEKPKPFDGQIICWNEKINY